MRVFWQQPEDGAIRNWSPQAHELVQSPISFAPDPAIAQAASPVAILATLWHGKYRIALVTVLLSTCVVAYAILLAPRSYSASAVVALNDRQEQAISLDTVMSGLSGSGASVYTEVEVLRSRNLIEDLVRQKSLVLDPEFNTTLQPQGWIASTLGLAPPDFDADEQFNITVDSVLLALAVANVRQSYVFRLTLTTDSAQKSADLANSLAELYIIDQLDTKFEATEKATVWLSGRVAELKLQLEKSETEAKSFSASIALVSPEALEAANRQLKDLRERRISAQAALAAARARLSRMAEARATGDIAAIAEIASNRQLDLLLQRNAIAPAELAALIGQIIHAQQVDSERLVSQSASLTASIVELEVRIKDQSGDLVQLTQLQREAEASRQIYEFFLARLKETEVQIGIQQADARILSRAVSPHSATSPRTGLLGAIAILAGLMLGIAWVVLREAMQTAFTTPDELERATGMAVLAQVPIMPVARRGKLLDFIVAQDRSPAVEAVRNLRTSILMARGAKPPQVVMLTSSQPGEGKTTHSLMLAQSFAGLGKSVLLIEGDIRKRVFSEYFEASTRGGIASAISDPSQLDPAIRPCTKLGIDVIMGEPSRINAADLFSSAKFRAFLDTVRARYDVIIIDMPPILAVPDARIVASTVDAVIYVARWGHTPRAQVTEGLRMLSSVNAPVLGVLMTQVDPRKAKRFGHYGYGTQGSYGS